MVRLLEALVLASTIAGNELFMFIDNLVLESGYQKGHSSSKKLSDIPFRLHKIGRDRGFKLHVIHVAGTWMKSWDIVGLSRGDLMGGG